MLCISFKCLYSSLPYFHHCLIFVITLISIFLAISIIILISSFLVHILISICNSVYPLLRHNLLRKKVILIWIITGIFWSKKALPIIHYNVLMACVKIIMKIIISIFI